MARPLHTVTTVAIALLVALSMSAAPAAALQDDDGLLGDDGSGLTDGLTGDGESPVGTDGVSVGGDEGVNVSTEGVSVAGTEVGTDSLDGVGADGLPEAPGTGDTLPEAPGDDGTLPVVPGGDEPLPDAPAPGDTLSGGDGPADGLPNASGVVGPDGIVDTEDSDVDLSRVDVLGPLPDTGENAETVADTLSVSTADSPVSPDQVPTDALPTEQAPGPEALPVGSESQVDCAKPIGADDLPAGAVPYIDDLPVQPPKVPLVPTAVTSPENLAGLGFSFAPDQCEIYDPDNPSVDPTDPPTDPSGEFQTASLSADDQEASYIGLSDGTLADGGPGYDSIWAFQLTGERLAFVQSFTVTDGRTDEFAGVESEGRMRRDFESSRSEVTVYVPGAGGLQTGFECGNVPEQRVDPVENPTATCQVDQPVPEVVTPEKVVDVITNPPNYDFPDIEGERLPIDV